MVWFFGSFFKTITVTLPYIITFTPRRPMEYISILPTPYHDNKAIVNDGKGRIYPKEWMPGI